MVGRLKGCRRRLGCCTRIDRLGPGCGNDEARGYQSLKVIFLGAYWYMVTQLKSGTHITHEDVLNLCTETYCSMEIFNRARNVLMFDGDLWATPPVGRLARERRETPRSSSAEKGCSGPADAVHSSANGYIPVGKDDRKMINA
ncbi:hypothetical protein B0O99DRAFT_590294 [Bisporella sp. PMI_857]|nr:hypothetical protein B0O99DRAFT_590294 [Bisporella sp. PMI_857]